MELKVWIGTVQRVISGVSTTTTSHEVIIALAQATGKTGKFTLTIKWRDYEKTLAPGECPLQALQSFGDYIHEVQFILRQTGENLATSNRRLADAKSPKPQRKRGGIKKSLSFSGGPQSTSPNRSPKLTNSHQAIPEEPTSHHEIEEDHALRDNTHHQQVLATDRSFRPIKQQTESDYSDNNASKQPHKSRRTRDGRSKSRDRRKTIENVEHTFYDTAIVPHSDDSSQSHDAHQDRQHRHRKKSETSKHRSRSSSRKLQPDYYDETVTSSNDYYESRAAVNKKREELLRERMLEEKAAAEHEARLREGLELQQTIINHERRLDDERRKLQILESDILKVTHEEEKKWEELYDCRDEITKALQTVQKLEIELESTDEVLLSEELNVLLRRQTEMEQEINEIQQQLAEYEPELNVKNTQSLELSQQLDKIAIENQQVETQVNQTDEEVTKLQKRVEEKKKFLAEAEDGYMSACDDLKEAEISLEKRKQMLVELERELREYNLKSFINTGFSEKTNETVNQVNPVGEVNGPKGLFV